MIIKSKKNFTVILQVKVTQMIAGQSEPKEVRRLKRGDYFGEKALLRLVTKYLMNVFFFFALRFYVFYPLQQFMFQYNFFQL